ncbi:MAG: GNAT family N-acetyltransferase [Owenweeksia sp.]
MMNINALFNIPVLETARLILQPIGDEHFTSVMSILGDREVRHGMRMDAHDTPEKQNAWWRRFEESRKRGEAVQWAAFLKENNTYASLLTVKEIDHNSHRGEVGYSVVKSLWGKGIASEGVKCVVDYMFNTVNIHSLIAQILPSNEVSQKIVSRLGFVKEAHFHDVHKYQEVYYDLLQFYKINPAHT